METFIPVLPKGRVGKDICFEVAPAGSLGSPARETTGNNIEPTPVAPAVFKKSLRDQLFFSVYMFDPLLLWDSYNKLSNFTVEWLRKAGQFCRRVSLLHSQPLIVNDSG
jgi:hypothetical protein